MKFGWETDLPRKSFTRIFLFALGLLSIAGCAKATAKPSENINVAKNSQPQEKAPVVLPVIAVDVSKGDAEKLAVQHLALRNERWGKPTDVLEEESRFLVFFSTPIQESRLVGPRVVLVDKASGLAHIKDRR